MIYDYKADFEENHDFRMALVKINKMLDEYRTCLKLLHEAQAEFLYEALSLRVGDSVPIGTGWSGYITSLTVELAETFLHTDSDNFCAYTLKYLPYTGKKAPVEVPNLPTIPLQVINTPPLRDEFQRKIGIAINKSPKAGRLHSRLYKETKTTAAKYNRLSGFLLSQGRKFCPFKLDRDVYVDGGESSMTESNPGTITSIGYLQLNPDSGLVHFPRGAHGPEGEEHTSPSSLFRLEAVYAADNGTAYYSFAPQHSCTGWAQSRSKKKKNIGR